MGFFRQQEERMAERLLHWQYQKRGVPVPDDGEMRHRAMRMVQEAHRIARERGRNILAILRDLARDMDES